MKFPDPKSLLQLKGLLHRDNHDLAGTVFISGTGRSGTTWVQEMINHDNSYRVIFEPFHSKNISNSKHPWEPRQYIASSDAEHYLSQDVRSILSGDIRSYWTDKFNTRFICKKRIVKDIRAQLFLHWVHVNLPSIPLIHIIRNPESVVRSKIRLGWESDLTTILRQERLLNDHLKPFLETIESANTPLEKHTVLWCVENYVPLKIFDENELLLVFYENLLNDPQREIHRIFNKLGETPPDDIASIASKPSALTNADSTNRAAPVVTTKQKESDEIDTDRIHEICKIFKLDKLYDKKRNLLIDESSAFDIV